MSLVIIDQEHFILILEHLACWSPQGVTGYIANTPLIGPTYF